MLHIAKKAPKIYIKKKQFVIVHNNNCISNKDTYSNDFVHVTVNFQTGQLMLHVFTGVIRTPPLH